MLWSIDALLEQNKQCHNQNLKRQMLQIKGKQLKKEKKKKNSGGGFMLRKKIEPKTRYNAAAALPVVWTWSQDGTHVVTHA